MKFQLWMITPAVTSYSPTFGVVRYRGPRAVIQFLCRTLCNLCSSSSDCHKWLQPVSLWKGKNVVHATHWQQALSPSTWIHHTPWLETSQVPKVWKSGADPLPSPYSAYIHSVRSPGEADESIWGAVGRCWTSPQHPRLDGHHERETRGGEKVRKILLSYRRWREEEKAWETLYLRQPGMPPCLQKGRQAVWEEEKHEEAECSLGLHANPGWQEISKNPTGGGPFSTSRQWNILSFYVVMMIATSHVQFKWLWGNVFFRWEPSGWVAASVHWTDGRTSSENLIPSNINFVSCTYLCLSDGGVLRNWTNPTQILSRVCPFWSTWVAGLTG